MYTILISVTNANLSGSWGAYTLACHFVAKINFYLQHVLKSVAHIIFVNVINMEVGLRKVGIYAKNSDDFHIGFLCVTY